MWITNKRIHNNNNNKMSLENNPNSSASIVSDNSNEMWPPNNNNTTTLDYRDYYAQFHGHASIHLDIMYSSLRFNHHHHAVVGQQQSKRKIIWLAGDSSLDNKYWIRGNYPAINGYEHVLNRMKPDVCYYINKYLLESSNNGNTNYVCINTAVEATALNDRACGTLLEPDYFLREHVDENDTVIVSIGGNDIALKPLLCTILNMLFMIHCVPVSCLRHGAVACPLNIHAIDCGCLCCGATGCLTSILAGWPPGLSYFVDLFGNHVKNYIQRLISGRRKPRKIIVCMIYFPLVDSPEPSWADASLAFLKYNSSPERLQEAIKTVFRLATEKIRIPGVEIIPFPLYEVLDGTDARDYVSRVEPSTVGGEKMAKSLVKVILENDL
jgi:hypothetical protein